RHQKNLAASSSIPPLEVRIPESQPTGGIKVLSFHSPSFGFRPWR
uniref:Uncharacterized protein n=1 Tax=Aegilops tauschii subsp. strangulata TaxID=200361 RepID=A0A452ZX25_AEGTS